MWRDTNPERAARFLHLTRSIFNCAVRGSHRNAFLREISTMVLEFSGCEAIEIRHYDGDLTYRWMMSGGPKADHSFDLIPPTNSASPLCRNETGALETLTRMVMTKSCPANLRCFTEGGSFWINDARYIPPLLGLSGTLDDCFERSGGACRALAILPFMVGSANIGAVYLKSTRAGCFDPQDIPFYEAVAHTIGLASADRRAQESLRERVKELDCLYHIAQIAEKTDLTREQKLEDIVRILPAAWHHPEICVAAIELDAWTCHSKHWREGRYLQRADIVVENRKRGFVEVAYVASELEFGGDPFLKEEYSLLSQVAHSIGGILEREEAEAIRRQEQIWHADRLATIGKMASGIAHELNEPLSSILGYAQLAKKGLDNSAQLAEDLDRIVNVSLHAREVVRKLLLFARQMPARRSKVALNQVVRDALTLIETRCAVEGIRVDLALADDLPEVEADASQLNQVLVNLMVNALQAMPQGGTLTISTAREPNCLRLTVEDTGVGMSADTKRQIFHPFFTTKDSQSTGLGLPVVHGIVTSHGGTIDVQTSPGSGARFTVRLPLPAFGEPRKDA